MLEARSTSHVVHSDLDVKFWMEAPPPTARVRPATCPECGGAARPLGARLHGVGRGVRERRVRGPLRAGGPGGLVVVRVRRFRCRVCGAVITVLPRGVAPRRHFGAGAMGLAIALVGGRHAGFSMRERCISSTRRGSEIAGVGRVCTRAA
ncbi:MAG TPA: hypothetical protein VKY73_02840, partial [Polyangiaceae bacterium]|nr:hypothetical protein [Polyangiaceae bacterium]